MRRLNVFDMFADRVAAINHDIIHATQELVYFFFVALLVELHLWPTFTFLKTATGILLVGIAFCRLFYHLIPYYLLRRLTVLSAEEKLLLISAHQANSADSVGHVLRKYFKPQSADRIAEVILRGDYQMLRGKLGV
jgi:hypothetical protein